MPLQDLAAELALLAGACVCLVFALILPQRLQGLCALLAVLTCCIAAGLALHTAVAAPPRLTFSGTFALDALSAGVIGCVCGTTALLAAASPRWFARDPRHGEYYALLLLAALGAALLAGASDATELLVAMLLSSVTGYTLASYHRASRMSAEAGAKYFLLGALSNPLLLLGVVFVYALAGGTRYSQIFTTLSSASADAALQTTALALVLVGLAFELGAAPTHSWVPDVSQGAPAPAAAFLTVAPKLGALAAIARFCALYAASVIDWRLLVALLSLVTMTLGNLAALWQQDVRRLLGWSSVSQAGYALIGVVALGRSSLALPSLLTFAVGYALANVAAFATVIALRGRTRFADYRGLSRARPWHAMALSVALLSLAGIPPLIGFGVKLTLFAAAIQAGYSWLALAAVINTVISLVYYLRLIATMVLEPALERPALLGAAETAVAACTSILIVLTGFALQFAFAAVRGSPLLPALL